MRFATAEQGTLLDHWAACLQFQRLANVNEIDTLRRILEFHGFSVFVRSQRPLQPIDTTRTAETLGLRSGVDNDRHNHGAALASRVDARASGSPGLTH